MSDTAGGPISGVAYTSWQWRHGILPGLDGPTYTMTIPVAAAAGCGPTALAAFDAALVHAGVADRNLIPLSSVLPPASDVRPVRQVESCPGEWGDRLYVVLSQAYALTPGSQGFAAIGWAQDPTGRGLLVEHHADDEATLRAMVDASLDAMCRVRGISLPQRGIHIAGTHCIDHEPTCALVVAVFGSTDWASTAPVAG